MNASHYQNKITKRIKRLARKAVRANNVYRARVRARLHELAAQRKTTQYLSELW